MSEISGTVVTPIAIGDVVTGTLSFAGEVKEYSLPVVAGDELLLVSSGSVQVELTVFCPNGL